MGKKRTAACRTSASFMELDLGKVDAYALAAAVTELDAMQEM